MKRIVILETLILALLLSLFLFHKNSTSTKTKPIRINNHKLFVEVADTDKLRTQGLSGRTNLPQDHGILFIFPTKGYYQFWMKDMKIPLDFIWMDKETIVDLTQNVPPPKSIQENLPVYSSKYPFNKVIELNAGVIKKIDIKIGDRVLL